MKFEIEKEKILLAASKCSQVRATLEILFPEAFADDGKIFTFPDEFVLSVRTTESAPIYVGKAAAPSYLRNKCLIVKHGWKAEIINLNYGYDAIVFKKVD